MHQKVHLLHQLYVTNCTNYDMIGDDDDDDGVNGGINGTNGGIGIGGQS